MVPFIQLKSVIAARRYAFLLGTQVGDVIDNYDNPDGNLIESLLNAWSEFIDQFQPPHLEDDSIAIFVAEAFRDGVSGRPSAFLAPGRDWLVYTTAP